MKKLSYRNNWESDEYSVDGRRVSNMTAVYVKEGQEFVQYPVTAKKVSVSYYDYGRTYYANSVHYFVQVSALGANIDIDLNQIITKEGVTICVDESEISFIDG